MKRAIASQTKDATQGELRGRWGPRTQPGLGWKESMLSGCVAGSVSKICTLPLDVTKKRMQHPCSELRRLDGFRPCETSYVTFYKRKDCRASSAGAFRGTCAHAGSFGVSISSSVMKTALSSGLSFATYEFMLQIL
eukprot:763833-Hanusia_phi.AAC.1